jgi:hypothetical protein
MFLGCWGSSQVIIAMRTLRNAKYRRGKNGTDCHRNVSRKRTCWPGQHLRCGICGFQFVFGAHGQTSSPDVRRCSQTSLLEWRLPAALMLCTIPDCRSTSRTPATHTGRPVPCGGSSHRLADDREWPAAGPRASGLPPSNLGRTSPRCAVRTDPAATQDSQSGLHSSASPAGCT